MNEWNNEWDDNWNMNQMNNAKSNGSQWTIAMSKYSYILFSREGVGSDD